MRYPNVIYGLAGATAIAAGMAWLLSATRIPPQPPTPVSMPATQEPGGRQEDAAPQSRPVAGRAETRTPGAVFEARFKASHEAPRPAPDPAVVNARTFPEAFQAMKRAEGSPPLDTAATNPFGTIR